MSYIMNIDQRNSVRYMDRIQVKLLESMFNNLFGL